MDRTRQSRDQMTSGSQAIAPFQDRPDAEAIRSIKESVRKKLIQKTPDRECSYLKDVLIA